MVRGQVRRLVLALLAGVAVWFGLVAVPGAAYAETYSAPSPPPIGDLPVATEVRTGYDRDLFRHWVDADGDGCDTRKEVLISEADDAPSVGGGCALRAGAGSPTTRAPRRPRARSTSTTWCRWPRPGTPAPALVGGDARGLRQRPRRRRSLVGVTASLNRQKGDQDVAEWLPRSTGAATCAEFVAVKIRWRLSVDSAEKSAMPSLASGCSNPTITVVRAR